MHCPACGAEYRAGFGQCADCGVDLVPGAAPPPRGDQPVFVDLVEVAVAPEPFMAELKHSLLEANGIDAYLFAPGLGPWTGVSAVAQLARGDTPFNSIRVMVRREDRAAALEILRVADEGKLQIDDTVDPGSSRDETGGELGQ